MRAARARTAVLLLVAVLVGALLGSGLSPASAAGLSKKAVKKIAAKVVAQQAPKLSVARAANADNATNAANAATLGGLSPAALQTAVRQYSIQPKGAKAQDQAWTLPDVPAGQWLATYSVSLDVEPGQQPSRCSVGVGTAGSAWSVGAFIANQTTCSGSAVIDVPAGGTVRLRTYSDGAVSDVFAAPFFASTVTLTRVDSLTSVTAP